MSRQGTAALAIGLAILVSLTLNPTTVNASAEPGATVRNVFGPDVGMGANQCRGACGGGCPDSCSIQVAYECMGSSRLRRVEAFSCGTHPGCREHDDCLDECLASNPQSGDCGSQCDARAMQDYGLESSASWMLGDGPYDGAITFEYTRHAPAALEPAYHCPGDAKRQCGESAGCIAASGDRVDPVFESYPQGKKGAMQISGFRAGPLCSRDNNSVCEHTENIRVTGADTCSRGRCTRFGMEFDYRNADPTAPLECSTSTRGGDDDFVGDLLKLGGDALTTRTGNSSADQEDGMATLLGVFGKVLASADSPEDVNISMAPLGEDGKPIESQRVGTGYGDGPPPIPRSIELPEVSGHLFVPMYQLADSMKDGAVKERRISCTHLGDPVLETVVRLQ
jgi:hypothetical protein